VEHQNIVSGTSYGRDAWFNALPSYIATPPLYLTSVNSTYDTFNKARNIFHCPTALSQPVDSNINLNTRCMFQYGMNSKGMWEQNGTVSVPILKTSAVRNPSAFVMFSDNRVITSDCPAWNPSNTTLGSPQNYTSRFSKRHSNGGNIAFSDGHAAHFKYDYVAVNHNSKPSDPAKPDINWSHDGTSVDGLPPQ